MRRRELIRPVSDWLGRRRLVWVGTRGADAESLTDLPQFDAAFSIIGALDSRSSIDATALEDLCGERPDLDTYELDDDRRAAVDDYRAAILRAVARPSVMVTYRPSVLVSGISFSRRDRCTYLGMFKDHQAAFEHKPWIETAIGDLALARIPWTYIADLDQAETLRLLEEGPVMLRLSRTTGGVGLVRLDRRDQLAAVWPDQHEGFVSVAPYIPGGLPVNVGAVAWHDGITVHPASVQLIGEPRCTTRPFGYCGNDFGALRQVDDDLLDDIQSATVAIGDRMRGLGYRGAFGVDFLVKDGEALFTEVNPRFQGSTHLSALASVEGGESCLLLEHVAALIGLDAPRSATVRDHAHHIGDLAHVVVHNIGPDAHVDPTPLLARAAGTPRYLRADTVCRDSLVAGGGATLARLTVRDQITADGFRLIEPWASVVAPAGETSDPTGEPDRGGRRPVGA